MAVVAARLDGDTDRPGLVHIDPFDRHARAPGGYSALELAARVADSGTGLVYWYGYEQHGAQGEAHKQLAALTTAPLWCGEVTVTGANDSLDAMHGRGHPGQRAGGHGRCLCGIGQRSVRRICRRRSSGRRPGESRLHKQYERRARQADVRRWARPISAGPHTGHKPGRLTAPDGHSRALTARNQRHGLICEDADLAPPIFQAGATVHSLQAKSAAKGPDANGLRCTTLPRSQPIDGT
jgi:hypothetical protein